MMDEVMELNKNEEEWEIPPEQDDGQVRQLWKCAACPYPETCTKSAFTNGKLWSWISDVKARSYIARHLNVSSLHSMDVPSAMLGAQCAAVEEFDQSFEERQMERREANERERKKPQYSTTYGGGKGGGRGSGANNYAGSSSSVAGARCGGVIGGGGRARARSRSPQAPIGGHRREARSSPRAVDAADDVARATAEMLPKLTTVLQDLGNTIAESRAPPPTPGSSPVSTLSLLGTVGPAPSGLAQNSSLSMAAASAPDAMVAIPASHILLLVQSIRQIRAAAENISVHIPVLTAAETALSQNVRN